MSKLTINHFERQITFRYGFRNNVRGFLFFKENKDIISYDLSFFSQNIHPDGFLFQERHDINYIGDDSIFDDWEVIGVLEDYPICKKIF